MVIVGQRNIPYNDLYILNKKERDAFLKGCEYKERSEYEVARYNAFLVVLPTLEKKYKAGLTPKKFAKLPWEEEEKPFKATDQAKNKAKKWGDIVRSGKIKPKENGKSKN